MLAVRDNSYASEIVRDAKTLILFIANFKDEHPTIHVKDIVADAFEKVSPYLKENTQVLYIRDNPGLCLKEGPYCSSECNGPNEATIAMPRWSDDEFQDEPNEYKEFHLKRLRST